MKANSSIFLVFFSALLFTFLWLGFAGAVQQGSATPLTEAPAASAADPATIITVTSGADPDTSDSTDCSISTCTLRRAVIQARKSTKPVLITFNIPKTPGEGYDDALKIWKIQFSGKSSASQAALRYLNGQITIDGTSAVGGRANGPQIILIGAGTGQDDGIKLGETSSQNSNEVRGLGFQNFKTHIYVNSDSNVIENNWFGLNDAGDAPFLRGGNPDDGSGNTAIAISSGSEQNLIQSNVFLGLDGVSINISGNHNQVIGNYVGTAADGTLPGKTTDPDILCTNEDWLGGGGISINGVIYSGVNNIISDNLIAGLNQHRGLAITTPPEAIIVDGTNHLIQNNQIGVDINGDQVGVCGRGLYITPSSKDNVMQVLSNTIANTGMSAISLNGVSYNAVLMRNNTIRQDGAWGVVEGNAIPEDAIQLGKTLPTALRKFNPAVPTTFDGVAITGSAGSPCANCVIELFLDDTDAITEALQSLALVVADASGNWSAVIPQPLTEGQGIRTTSTTAKTGTISGLSAGATSGLSRLYEPITPPDITIADAQIEEGNSGTKDLNFTVSLSAIAKQQITVDYATADGSATTANNDYQAKNGTVIFEIGEQQKTLSIVIQGDTDVEPDETLLINLSDAVNGVITDAQATGALLNDDQAPSSFFVYLPILLR